MEDEPIAVSLAGPDGNNMGDERFFFPIFAERYRNDTALLNFLPDCVRSHRLEEVFDKTLDLFLGLVGGKLWQVQTWSE